jgi:DNA-binding MarR family transcriptional regulator
MSEVSPPTAPGSADPVAESAARTAHELRSLFSRLRRRLREVAATDDLSPSQIAVLGRLGKDGPASASTLAVAERVRPQSMAATLAALDQQGLIRRDPDPEDGRRQVVTLTGPGRERVGGTRSAGAEWLVRAMHERFTEAERRTVLEAVALLDRVTRP